MAEKKICIYCNEYYTDNKNGIYHHRTKHPDCPLTLARVMGRPATRTREEELEQHRKAMSEYRRKVARQKAEEGDTKVLNM